MQCTGTAILFQLITELLPFVTFSCPEHNLKTIGWNLIKLHTVIDHNERKCSVQEPQFYFSQLQSYCPLLLFSCPEHNLKTTGWNVIKLYTMVQHNEKEFSVHESLHYFSKLQSYCLFLCFFLSNFCPDSNLKTT